MQFRNLTVNDLDFALNPIKIEKWGTSREELEDLLLFAPNCAILAIMKKEHLGMLESNTFASEIAKNCNFQLYSYSNRMIYISENQKIITNNFKKGMLAIGGPDRG